MGASARTTTEDPVVRLVFDDHGQMTRLDINDTTVRLPVEFTAHSQRMAANWATRRLDVSGPLPPALRSFNRCYALYEEPPRTRLVSPRVPCEKMGCPSGISCVLEDYLLPIPWLSYVLTPEMNELLSAPFVRPRPIAALDDLLVALPLPNMYTNYVCLSSGLDHLAPSTAPYDTKLAGVFAAIWHSRFNHDICTFRSGDGANGNHSSPYYNAFYRWIEANAGPHQCRWKFWESLTLQDVCSDDWYVAPDSLADDDNFDVRCSYARVKDYVEVPDAVDTSVANDRTYRMMLWWSLGLHV